MKLQDKKYFLNRMYEHKSEQQVKLCIITE